MLSASDAEKIVLSKFNEAGPEEHQMKIIVGCGAQLAFRGCAEHCYLTVAQLE